MLEVLLAASIFGLLAITLVGSYLFGEESTALAGSRSRAALYAEEGLEALRNIRDAQFSNLTNGTYGLAIVGNQWTLSTSTDTNGIYTRTISIGTIDANRKAATSTVTWQQNGQRSGSIALATRLTNWLVSVGSWATPTTTSSVNIAGNNNGLKVALAGNYAYMIRDNGNPDFAIIDVTNPAAPVQLGSLSLTGTPASIVVSGNYAYVSGNGDNSELIIINIANPNTPSIAGTYNATGAANATGIAVVGTTVYLGRNNATTNEFSILNASNPAAPVLLGSLDLGGTANDIVVMGNYAYVASSNDTQELQIINVSNPASPSLAGSLNLSANDDAVSIAGFGSTVVLGRASTLYTINVTSPAAPTIIGTLALGGTVNDISLGFGNTLAFIASANTNQEFQVVDISTLSSPVLFGSINLSGGNTLAGVAYDAVNDRAYAVGSPNAQEFFIFSPS